MRVALIGEDQRLPAWGTHVARCGARITFVSVAPQLLNAVRRLAPGAASNQPGGTAAILDRNFDVAIIGGDSQEIVDTTHALATFLPVLVIPTARQSNLLAYHLVLAVEEGARVVPAFANRFFPAVQELADRLRRGELGDVRLLRMERVAPASSARPGLVDVVAIDDRFFEDVDLLRSLGGEFSSVTAVLVGAQNGAALQGVATLTGRSGVEAAWQVSAGSSEEWRLTLTGSRGTAMLVAAETCTLTVEGTRIETPTRDPVESVIRRFIDETEAEPGPDSGKTASPGWEDYVRAYDLLEAFHRSLRRRRTIDLQLESVSERRQFKTQMTTIGCGVLVWAMLGTFLGLILGQVLDPRDPLERRADAARTVLREEDFDAGTSQLRPEAAQRVANAAERDGADAIVVIEALSDDADGRRGNARKEFVTATLRDMLNGMRIPPIDIRVLSGQWFRRTMVAVWVVVFAPLVVFLGLQVLILLTRSRS